MKIKRFVIITVGLLVAIIALSETTIISHAKGRLFADVSKIPAREVALLLGCSKTLANGQSNAYFSYRIAAASDLYNTGKIKRIIVSGDNSRKGYDESTNMKDALMAGGVKEEHIVCDFAGFSTLDSVVRSKAIFQQSQLTIISQDFHNERAIFIAQSSGIDAIGFNAQNVATYGGFLTRVRERLARVKAMLDVYVFQTRPKFFGPVIQIQ